MTYLLDANVLIALTVPDHVFHDAAQRWFTGAGDGFATCPITEGALVRFLLREGQSADVAQSVLHAITEVAGHEFWPDEVSYRNVSLSGVLGHRQVTDAYLAGLARWKNAALATFDAGAANLHRDVSVLVPS